VGVRARALRDKPVGKTKNKNKVETKQQQDIASTQA